ncbi:hypothetical protein PR048_028350 [Dryococelus australis]|uniref:Uncharacterized protein n=1 Tax=Dryococelus australis TaxID=614101 RepID=A0ABQ9GIZ1_9NEOP|nr:hypothetical protein PR048_028350 [Dryococelus australis]
MLDEDSANVIPETLKVFTENVTKKNNELPKFLHRKQIIINHSIIAACRPRSFHSTIHIALADYLYRRYGSGLLIDIFNSMVKKKHIPVEMYKKPTSMLKTITITPIHISGETSKEIDKAIALNQLAIQIKLTYSHLGMAACSLLWHKLKALFHGQCLFLSLTLIDET